MRRLALAGAILLFSTGSALAQTPQKVILSLGNDTYLPRQEIEAATGAKMVRELKELELKEVSVLLLSNIAFTALPQPVQTGLVDFVTAGGGLLITGGPQSFGSGGYQAVGPIIPFNIRSSNDWMSVPFKPGLVIQSGNPVIAGVTFPTFGTFNDLNPRPGASEVLQYAGGGLAEGGARYPSPLIAELRSGGGLVVGVAFDPNQMGNWPDASRFGLNVVRYLFDNSRLGPPKPKKK